MLVFESSRPSAFLTMAAGLKQEVGKTTSVLEIGFRIVQLEWSGHLLCVPASIGSARDGYNML